MTSRKKNSANGFFVHRKIKINPPLVFKVKLSPLTDFSYVLSRLTDKLASEDPLGLFEKFSGAFFFLKDISSSHKELIGKNDKLVTSLTSSSQEQQLVVIVTTCGPAATMTQHSGSFISFACKYVNSYLRYFYCSYSSSSLVIN